ncbi:hypothetical protein TNCV_1715801 [Trichonephila clavipes]|nr:hypothetical protein TNCV_1715801 [Trichonephila clavipes]
MENCRQIESSQSSAGDFCVKPSDIWMISKRPGQCLYTKRNGDRYFTLSQLREFMLPLNSQFSKETELYSRRSVVHAPLSAEHKKTPCVLENASVLAFYRDLAFVLDVPVSGGFRIR